MLDKFKLMFRWLYVITLVLAPQSVYSQISAEIENVKIQHHAAENGNSGMKFHVKFNINGAQNRNCHCTIFFYGVGGNALVDRNQNYRTTDGKVSVGTSFTPPYEGTVYPDLEIFMPYRELDLTDNEGGILSYNVVIRDDNWYTLCEDTGKFRYSQYGSPYSPLQRCSMCYGSHLCSSCNGTGISKYSKSICYSCNGAGLCPLCKGNDWARFKAHSEDYSLPSTYQSVPPVYDGTPNNYGNNSSNQRMCRNCNGTGRVKVYISSAVYDSNVSVCSECNEVMHSYDKHIHQSCSVCYGKGYLE